MGEAWEPLAEIVPPALPTEPVGELPTTVVTPEPTSLEPSNVVPVPEAPLSKKEGEKSLEEVVAHELKQIAYLKDAVLFDTFVAWCERKRTPLNEQLVSQLELEVGADQLRLEGNRDYGAGDPLLYTDIGQVRQALYDQLIVLRKATDSLPGVEGWQDTSLGTNLGYLLESIISAVSQLNDPNHSAEQVGYSAYQIREYAYKLNEMKLDLVLPALASIRSALEVLLDSSKVMDLLEAITADAQEKSKANRVYLAAKVSILNAIAAQKAAQPAASTQQ